MVALVVVVWALARRLAERRMLLVAAVFPAVAVVVVLVRDAVTYAQLNTLIVTQGRFLFPAIGAALVVQALAWRALVVDDPVRRGLARATTIAAPTIAVAGLLLAYGGFYEGLRFRVSTDGRDLLAQTVPYGTAPLLAVVVLTAVAVAAAIALTWRWRAPTAVPLDSPPTVEPTVRNQIP